MASPIAVTDVDDPRIADYRLLKERHLNTQGGRFIAESELVVRRLLASGLRVHSILATPVRLGTLSDVLPDAGDNHNDDPPSFPVYVADQPTMDRIAGFHVHRGCLAVGERPAHPRIPPGARTVVVLEDVVYIDNIGSMVRNAAALGADALCLSPQCADPFYRKGIRTSLGSVFTLPIVRFARWPEDLIALRAEGFTLVAATPAPDATPLHALPRPPRLALLLGAEGPGLTPATMALADHRVSIPMSPAADSLNIATAGAILLYTLRQ